MSRKFFRQIGMSLDNVVDKTPDAQTAFIPLQALFFYVIGIVCFVSGPKYIIGGLVCFGIASLGMLLFVSLIRERFSFIYFGGECIGLAFTVMTIIFFIQNGFSSVTLLFAAFAFWYLTFGTLGIFLTEALEKNWWLLGIAHSILIPGMNFIGVWPSYYWLTLPFLFVTIALTVAFIPLCLFQPQSKEKTQVHQ